MKEVILKIDDKFYKDIDKYLITLNGIENSKINVENNQLYIKYDMNIISLNILKLEILTYLGSTNIPLICSFDKCSKKQLNEYKMIIKNLCCEYCLKKMIEELLLIDGIEFATSNFDFNNKKDVQIYIKYDDKLITTEKILILEKEYNL